ncbi:acetyltransferase-like isoleucine patch superfamily enzyme [Arthrobacter stackebrandtii]|uniref:Acetyltransferase-like isoleucine patch superfamily enzyme n=1 Tax=Arthrobacter stackebrandtii TaxID=272161 RepID=A0ABS4Z016_9MICC|nr:acyltransferase [Arthrobacter stackebrandtii]MBP2414050.1 acetyltransferase-like isoleucine patch superfamily enzyme [Arthrobacter stackebrandtii]PYG99411.1 acyltransferase [Arthrobacter stackebrandtii]
MTRLEAYEDERGNKIVYDGIMDQQIQVRFSGSNNTLTLHPQSSLHALTAHFDCDNGQVSIGSTRGVTPLKAYIRVGQDSTVTIGDNVSNSTTVTISAVEGTHITIGNDCMLSSQVEIRTDDAHPIFDVRTGKRSNPSRSIRIGNHVWLAKRSAVLGGASIADGSVLGFGSILTGKIPNNSIAVGTPAKVVRRDVVWERPHLSLREPFYKPDSSSIEKSGYWDLTDEAELLDPQLPIKAKGKETRWFGIRIRSLRAKAWRLRRRLLAR